MTLTEAQTRAKMIDVKLALAGWNVKDKSQVTEELDIDLTSTGIEVDPDNKYSGHQFADYALLVDGKPFAVVEAKKASRDAELGKEQALQYAQNLQKLHGGPLPFIFYTNGHEIFFWDSEFYAPRKVHGFPTKLELEWMAQKRETRKPLSVELIDTDIAGRDYQISAIRRILEDVEKARRKFLLVMATGTGKTRTATALMDILLRAHWAKRVLFLVDRIALRDQALDAFVEFLPSSPVWPQRKGNSIEKKFQRERRIYVNTYPTMLNLIEKGQKPADWISPFFFDAVIADESHRSIYNVYKSVLTYFDALTIGLTATPRDHIDHDTFNLFDCKAGDPTFAYSFEEAIAHVPPFLCDFEVLNVRSKFQLEGIKGKELPPAVQRKLIAEGKDIEDIDFEGTDLERKVSNSGTNALIVREFMEESIKDTSGTLPGKTIIFAISKGHARRLQTLFDSMYPEHKGKLARVLVSQDPRVYGKGGLLDQFKKNPFPRVAISVDMLDTGVDIREVVNLVFAKPVYSYTKFWQMIGRGTRVLEEDPKNSKPYCLEKDKFLIIDCWGNFERFKMKPKGREPSQQVPMPVKLFRSRLAQLEAAMKAGETEIVERVKATLRADIADLPQNNVIVDDSSKELAEVASDQFWKRFDERDIAFLKKTIAPVLRARSGIEIKAFRFENDVVDLSTAILTNNAEMTEAIKKGIIGQTEELPLSVNVVEQESKLIESVLEPEWWDEPTDSKLVSLIDRLAPLMKYRQRRSEAMMTLDLDDLVKTKEYIEFGPENERITTSAYREKVETHILAMVEENAVLQRIKTGEPVGENDIEELAVLLSTRDPYITEELLRKVYEHKAARFIRFIRHILDIEHLGSWSEEVTAAFDDFISKHNTFTHLQIQFLQTLKTFILQNGRVEKKDLIEAPFTQLHPRGIRGVFGRDEIDEILTFTQALSA